MTLDEIYNWLFKTDPEDENIRGAWINMASYCYFINIIDFDSRYRDRLKRLLQKSREHNIHIPDENHQKIINLARTMHSDSTGINKLLYG